MQRIYGLASLRLHQIHNMNHAARRFRLTDYEYFHAHVIRRCLIIYAIVGAWTNNVNNTTPYAIDWMVYQ